MKYLVNVLSLLIIIFILAYSTTASSPDLQNVAIAKVNLKSNMHSTINNSSSYEMKPSTVGVLGEITPTGLAKSRGGGIMSNVRIPESVAMFLVGVGLIILANIGRKYFTKSS